MLVFSTQSSRDRRRVITTGPLTCEVSVLFLLEDKKQHRAKHSLLSQRKGLLLLDRLWGWTYGLRSFVHPGRQGPWRKGEDDRTGFLRTHADVFCWGCLWAFGGIAWAEDSHRSSQSMWYTFKATGKAEVPDCDGRLSNSSANLGGWPEQRADQAEKGLREGR